ncbi:MAG: hypothetical protein AB4426_23610 [Xenococcaceae cyanobacterium]
MYRTIPVRIIIEQRINFLVKVLAITLTFFGSAIALSQIVKVFLEGWNERLGIAIAIGLLLVGFGQPPNLKKILENGLFSQRSRLKIWVFVMPIILSGAVVLWRLNITHTSWKRIESEGGLFEYGTSLAYIVAFIFALPIARYFYQIQQKKLGFFYYFMAGCFLFVGLEELSWGQHLLGWRSPGFFEAYNSQKETTLHNLIWVSEYIDYGYCILGLVGGLAWLFIPRMKNWRSHAYFIPDWYLSSFFLLVYYSYTIKDYYQEIQSILQSVNMEFLGQFILSFGEFAELLLGLGFLLFVLVIYVKQAFEFH